jgi:hypothetical protein
VRRIGTMTALVLGLFTGSTLSTYDLNLVAIQNALPVAIPNVFPHFRSWTINVALRLRVIVCSSIPTHAQADAAVAVKHYGFLEGSYSPAAAAAPSSDVWRYQPRERAYHLHTLRTSHLHSHRFMIRRLQLLLFHLRIE